MATDHSLISLSERKNSMKCFLFSSLSLIVLTLFPGCPPPGPEYPYRGATTVGPDDLSIITDESASLPDGRIVVTNRSSGSISVISTSTDAVTGTYDLPQGDLTPEPMYIAWIRSTNRVFVGDRANDRVVVFNGTDFSVVTTIPAGDGVFHMWADETEGQLWVVNDIDKTATVIHPGSMSVITTVPMPADLIALGGIPHDVILEPRGRLAFVTIIGAALDSHYVVQFRTDSFQEQNRAIVGRDAHLSLTPKNDYLYLPCQGSSVVKVLHRKTLAPVASIDIPAAHGAGMPRNGQTFYTSNFSGLGTDGLYAIDIATNAVLGSTDTPFAVPHNIVLTPDGERLYLTHSGATSNTVTVYATNGGGVPVYLQTIEVGLNPFGVAFVR